MLRCAREDDEYISPADQQFCDANAGRETRQASSIAVTDHIPSTQTTTLSLGFDCDDCPANGRLPQMLACENLALSRNIGRLA